MLRESRAPAPLEALAMEYLDDDDDQRAMDAKGEADVGGALVGELVIRVIGKLTPR